MTYTNEKIRRVKPSETLAVKARATELKAQGKSIIDLSTGEPDIDTPEHIKEAARQAMASGKTKYTAVGGIIELRQALAEKLMADNSIPAAADDIIVTNGGKHALFAAFDVVLQPGDEVIIPAPYWVSYVPMVEMAGGRAVVVKTDASTKFRLTPDALRAAMTPQTKMVVLNSPSNPAGIGYTKQQLQALGEVIAPTKALVVSDEVYEKATFSHFTFSSFAEACPDLIPRLVTVNAFSKTYSMTGWRVGYATGPREIIGAMGRHQSQITSNVCSIAQYAAIAALKGSHDFIKPMVASFDRRIASARAVIDETPGLSLKIIPDGAFYLFIHFDRERLRASKAKIENSSQFVTFLLDYAGVAAVQGEAFGDDDAFRISVAAADAEVQRGVEAIAGAMREIL